MSCAKSSSSVVPKTDDQLQQIRFIGGPTKSKVLVYQDHIFHANRKSNQSTYFKCAYAKKVGCSASINVYGLHPEFYTFDSFTVINGEHSNHLPSTEKILRREGKAVENVKDKRVPVVESAAFKNCQHVCLFCFAKLPAGYREVTSLENVLPTGDIQTIPLDNQSNNLKAFELLCNRIGVNWKKSKDGLSFVETSALPLCFKCRMIHQEMFQLHVQIQMLEELISKYAGVIRSTIEKSESKIKADEGLSIERTQLLLLGLDVFRRKVIISGQRRLDASAVNSYASSLDTTTATSLEGSKSTQSPTEEVDEIKQEVDPLEEIRNYEDASSDLFWGADESNTNSFLEDNTDDFGGDENLVNSDSESKEEETSRSPNTRARSSVLEIKKEIPEDSVSFNKDGLDGSRNEGEDDTRKNVNEEDEDDPKDRDFEMEETPVIRRSTRRTTLKSKLHRPFPKKRPVRSNPPTSLATKEYECHICSAPAIGYNTFIEHYNIHHPDEKRYTCKFCKRHFSDLRDCVVHQRHHTGERPFKCSKCPSAFTSKRALVSHMFHRHTDRTSQNFRCQECNKEFTSKFVLTNHLTAVHDHAPPQYYPRSGKPLKSWTCHLCDKKVTGLGPFIQHYTEFHPDEKRYTCKFCQKYFRDHRDCTRHQRKHTGERPFPCNECNKAFRDEKTLRSHCRLMHSDVPLSHVCQKCGKRFPSKSALNAHSKVHDQLLLFCMTCGKGFRHLGTFSKHKKIAHDGQAEHSEPIKDASLETLESFGIPNFQTRTKCHICWKPVPGKILLNKHFEENHPDHKGGIMTCKCGKQFGNYRDCCKHAIRHSNNKTFQCDQCALTFFTATELRNHATRHAPLEERQNNVCDICGLGLVSPFALAKHKRKHENNQTRWVCEECGKSYAEKKGLNHHTKTAHLKILPYKCTYCEKAYSLRTDLEKHVRIHTGQKPFKCPMCEKCFPYTSSRSRHLREVHNLEGKKSKGPTPRKKKRNRQKKDSGGGGQMATSTSSALGIIEGGYQSIGHSAIGLPLLPIDYFGASQQVLHPVELVMNASGSGDSVEVKSEFMQSP